MKVSVALVTYNHERYIRQALDSVLSQQTTFDFEVIVSEDRSTDATREIIVDYSHRYPERIRLILSEENVNTPWVLQRAIMAARGEYVAVLDGDDYWTSPHKLQKQVKFMDACPEYVLSWHASEWVDADGSLLPNQQKPLSKSNFTLHDFLVHYPLPETASVMIRNPLPELPEWYRTCPVYDYPLWCIVLRQGTAGYFDDSMSAWRYHPASLTSRLNELEDLKLNLDCYRLLFHNLGAAYQPVMRKRLALLWRALAIWQSDTGDKAASLRTAREGLRDCPNDRKLYLLAHAPWLWRPASTVLRLSRIVAGRRKL